MNYRSNFRFLIVLIFTFTFQLSFGQHNTKSEKHLPKPAYVQPGPVTGPTPSSNFTRSTTAVNYMSMPNSAKPGLQSQQAARQMIEMKRSEDSGMPIFIKMKSEESLQADFTTQASVKKESMDFLKAVKPDMQIRQPEDEFEVFDYHEDEQGNIHVKLRQYFEGIPVYASEVLLHFQANGEQLMNGRYHSTPVYEDLEASISKELAINMLITDLKTKTEIEALNDFQRKILKYSGPVCELVLLPQHGQEGQFNLAWHITIRPNFVRRWEYFIDAHNGQVLDAYDHTCEVLGSGTDLNGNNVSFEVYNDGGTYNMVDISRPMFNSGASSLPNDPVGAIWTIDARNTDLNDVYQVTSSNKDSWSDASAVSAHYNGGLTYDYYKDVHGRNAIDGNGGTIVSCINVTDGGSSMENAYWNGEVMAYGNGGSTFKPLAGALDVAAHEMTHGVISKTANLEYKFQSGAINESMADIFGAMVDRDDWQMGEDIMQSGAPSSALRDLQNPNNGGSDGDWWWQPDHMDDFKDLNSWEDNGGVHINSGIPNKAFYNYATAVTKGKAEKVYYKALTDYLTRSSEFIDLRIAVIQAATDLYGASSSEVSAAETAFFDVGIGDAPGGNYEQDLNENEGNDYILAYSVAGGDQNTFYIYDPVSPTNKWAMSNTVAYRKASITDDGQWALFVGDDSEIHSLFLDKDNPVETVLTSDGFWDNVAISKDGSQFVAITEYADTTLYVYNFDTQIWSDFTLYNPTFSQGVVSDGPLYADALEWDYSGEYVMYDAFNRITTNSGTDIEYWDVGIMQVWDNAANDVGDGSITKLYSQLEEDISIGNPIFAKNSPYIIAYDLWDIQSGDVEVQGANIESGASGLILGGITSLSNPSYSKSDDKIALTTGSNTTVSTINMKADKITSNGSPSTLVADAKWPVWFSQGYRTDINEHSDSYEMELFVYPNPAQDKLKIEMAYQGDNRPLVFKIFNVLGEEVGTYPFQAGLYLMELEVSHLTSGVYLFGLDEGQKRVQNGKFVISN